MCVAIDLPSQAGAGVGGGVEDLGGDEREKAPGGKGFTLKRGEIRQE